MTQLDTLLGEAFDATSGDIPAPVAAPAPTDIPSPPAPDIDSLLGDAFDATAKGPTAPAAKEPEKETGFLENLGTGLKAGFKIAADAVPEGGPIPAQLVADVVDPPTEFQRRIRLGGSALDKYDAEDLSARLGVSPEDITKWRGMGKIGFFENIEQTTTTEAGEKLPFVGPLFTIADVIKFREHASTLKSDHDTIKDLADRIVAINKGEVSVAPEGETLQEHRDSLIQDYKDAIVKMQATPAAKFMDDYLTRRAEVIVRSKSVPAKIGSGLAEMPAYMIEFLATGGIYSAAKKGSTRLLTRFAGKFAKKRLGKFLIAAAATASASAARTLVLGAEVIAAGEKAVLPNIQRDPNGVFHVKDSDKGRLKEYFRAFSQQFIENFSETLGGPGRKWLRANHPRTAAFFSKLGGGKRAERLGFHGFIEEFSEERASQIMRKAVTALGFDLGEENWLPTMEQLMVEIGVLAVPSAVSAAFNRFRGDDLIGGTEGDIPSLEELEAAAGTTPATSPRTVAIEEAATQHIADLEATGVEAPVSSQLEQAPITPSEAIDAATGAVVREREGVSPVVADPAAAKGEEGAEAVEPVTKAESDALATIESIEADEARLRQPGADRWRMPNGKIDRRLMAIDIANRIQDLEDGQANPSHIIEQFIGTFENMSPDEQAFMGERFIRPMGAYPGFVSSVDRDGKKHVVSSWAEAIEFVLGDEGNTIEGMSDIGAQAVAFMDIMLGSAEIRPIAEPLPKSLPAEPTVSKKEIVPDSAIPATSDLGSAERPETGPVSDPPLTPGASPSEVLSDLGLTQGTAPLSPRVDLSDAENTADSVKELGIQTDRKRKVLLARAAREVDTIKELVPDQERREDLRVLAENGTRNIRTGRTAAEIRKGLTPQEKKAVALYRQFQEAARNTVNDYLKGAGVDGYISFLEDYFIHSYKKPLSEKDKSAVTKWAKTSPQAKKRVLPTLEDAVDMGLVPRTHDLAEGLALWADINYRVATNKAFLQQLPEILNADGESVLQKPADKPNWPTVDYWPIRKRYAVPFKDRGILLVDGRVAVDPSVKKMIDALFDTSYTSKLSRSIAAINATAKSFALTVGSFFHHQAETFSAIGSLGPRRVLTGFWGKEAAKLGGKRFLGLGPHHIGVLKAGKALTDMPEFMDDFLSHGGHVGYISGEGINTIERMLIGTERFFDDIAGKSDGLSKIGAKTAKIGATALRGPYQFMQRLLWDNVLRAKLVAYYKLTSMGLDKTDLPPKRVKELVNKYLADNFGGQEWLDSAFKNPKTRWWFTQLFLSIDWTWSQLKTPLWLGGKGVGARTAAERTFARKLGRNHWMNYIGTIAAMTVAANYMFVGHGPWDNEKDREWDVDWTPLWRAMDEMYANMSGNPNWKERGDKSRRYIGLGKAGREILRWVQEPVVEFGNKLSPVASTLFEQATGASVGSSWREPWAQEDLDAWEEAFERSKHVAEKFKPFSLSDNNAFLAFPSRKGMTPFKANKAYHEIFKAKGNIAAGGLTGQLAKMSRFLEKDDEKLFEEISAAAIANGIDPEKARRAGMAKARSDFYRLFWRACKAQDVDGANKWAKALNALGVTRQAFSTSAKSRSDQLSDEARTFGREVISEQNLPSKARGSGAGLPRLPKLPPLPNLTP